MKVLVVYKSKTGFTKKYAEWIRDALGCDILELSKVKASSLSVYQLILFGGGVMAGKINGLSCMKRLMEKQGEKKWILFADGATPAEDKKNLMNLKNNNLTAEEQLRIPLFYFQSGLNYKAMNLPNRMLMKVLRSGMSSKKDPTEDEKEMLKAISTSFDASSKDAIQDLLSYIKDRMNA